jgi:hypothetical protein
MLEFRSCEVFRDESRSYGPVVMSDVVVFLVLRVFGLGMFSDTIVGTTDRCWMLVAVAFLVWEI